MPTAKRMARRLGGLLGCLIILCAVSVPSAGSAVAQVPGATPMRQTIAPSTPIQAALRINTTPGVGQPATLTCTVTSILDAPGVTVTLELPEATQVLDGEVLWTGDLIAGQPQIVTTSVSFDTTGDKAVYCRALGAEMPDGRWGDLAQLYLNVGAESGSPGYAPVPKQNRIVQGARKDATAAESTLVAEPLVVPDGFQPPEPPVGLPPQTEGSAPAPVNAPASGGTADGPVTVSGSWSYYDRDGAYVGAKEMEVELVLDDATWTHLAWARTSVSGEYTFETVTIPTPTSVRVILWTYTGYLSDVLAVVYTDWGTTVSWDNMIGVSTFPVAVSDGALNIGDYYVTSTGNWDRAFWIQRDLVDAYRYVYFQAGSAEIPVETAGSVTVQWMQSSTDGDYYSFGGNVHLQGDTPLSDTVVNHEYGHNIMYTVYGNTFPATFCPSPHYLTDNEDRGCSWTEGWASFLSMAVKNEPVYRWASGSYTNVDTPTWGTPGWNTGDDVEGHVAGGLWDMLDSGTEGYDKYSGDFADIWATLYHQNDGVMSEYWDAWWYNYGYNYPGAIMSLYQSTIDYRSLPVFRGDFEGNRATELSVWRPTNGTWYIKDLYNAAWGVSGDIPVPGDYNGDKFGEAAVWRQTTGIWYIKGMSNYLWGQVGDQPVPGDYDGDNIQELAVFRPSNHTWYIKGVGTYSWGASSDLPVPGDYNNDGTTEIAVWRPSTGVWYIKGYGNYTWGQTGDLPVPGDYNGGGATDIAVWRPSNGIWYVRTYTNSQWGMSGDIPVPGDYDGDVYTEFAVWRPSTGMWYVKNHFSSVWGSNGDLPVLAPQWYYSALASPGEMGQ